MSPTPSAMTPESIYQQLNNVGSGDNVPPIERWNPPLSGDMDLVIKRDGSWIHEGRAISRQGLVKTFSRVLKREHDEYFLVTPVEKWRIQVETVPFFVASMQLENPGESQVIQMATATDNQITLNADHPLWVEYDDADNPTPLILVRTNLAAQIGRNVYNELCEISECIEREDKTVWQIRSCGDVFLLGESTSN